jgi:large subunit ribosomal protein L9
MKVILREDVKDLGKMGAVVNVSDGYARNFLIPKGVAAVADTKNIRALEHEKRVIEDRARKLMATAQSLADRISSTSVTLRAKAGEEEKLFGSITAMDIAEALKAEGIGVDKKRILLEEPIKRLGAYTVNIRVATDVTAVLNLRVEAE